MLLVTLPDEHGRFRPGIELRLRNPCASHATPSGRVELSANDMKDAQSH
jgi:hypothetical protein